MNIKLVYPSKKPKKKPWKLISTIMGFAFIISIYCCILINILVGGKAWCVIVAVGCFMAWSLIFSPAVIDYNIISEFIKLVVFSCILLLLIDILLVPGWIIDTEPWICFGGLVASSGLLYIDLNRQRQNCLAVLLLIVISIAFGIVGLCLKISTSKWVFLVLLSSASFDLFLFIYILKMSFIDEIKKRLNTR